MKLYKGRATAVSATSPTSLYDTKLASFAMKGYDVTAARGFIDLFGLPMKVRGLKQKAPLNHEGRAHFVRARVGAYGAEGRTRSRSCEGRRLRRRGDKPHTEAFGERSEPPPRERE